MVLDARIRVAARSRPGNARLSILPYPKVLARRGYATGRPHRAPRTRFEFERQDHHAEKSLRVIIGWGRYADLFAYDDRTRTFELAAPMNASTPPLPQTDEGASEADGSPSLPFASGFNARTAPAPSSATADSA
jgi:hypothetical protein